MRIFSRLAVCVILFAVVLAGCTQPAAPEPGPEPSTTPTFKIGILTGTVSQGEDEYRAAEQVKAKYGDRIVHVTYPDNFMQEQERPPSASSPGWRQILM
jgi:hypothetical protein